jgi:hypothetical protein
MYMLCFRVHAFNKMLEQKENNEIITLGQIVTLND